MSTNTKRFKRQKDVRPSAPDMVGANIEVAERSFESAFTFEDRIPRGNVATVPLFELANVGVTYSGNPAVRDVDLVVPQHQITAFIGPSGCGKSTLLRCLNRMNDLIPGAQIQGKVTFAGQDLYDPTIDPVDVRRRIGMVFQKPNPFPKSIRENITFGMKVNGIKATDELVEQALRSAAIWDEVKDRLDADAYSLSGGQQQRLCIARALAVNPDVLLMDEPCSALDPISTLKIEELMFELRREYTIVIVTHNMQQAARASDYTAFFLMDSADRAGQLIEYGPSERLFTNPHDKRTEEYITGRFG
jgi:phosphate transport system ATP-binding protein